MQRSEFIKLTQRFCELPEGRFSVRGEYPASLVAFMLDGATAMDPLEERLPLAFEKIGEGGTSDTRGDADPEVNTMDDVRMLADVV